MITWTGRTSQSDLNSLDLVSTRLKTLPTWALVSLAFNGLLMLAMFWVLQQDRWLSASSPSRDFATVQTLPRSVYIGMMSKTLAQELDLGVFHQLSYEQWVALLRREAEVAVRQQPKHLTVIAGDSLSLWFPTDLLPTGRSWLNQAISGETSAGLLRRLAVFDSTQPEVIFVMIGINDLLRGSTDAMILDNQQQIIRYLRRVHPQSQIVVQSILPHTGANSNEKGSDRFLKIPNTRIRQLNRQLSAIAIQENALYLDLHPLFTDFRGNLRIELTTDGLHLSRQGYLVWRSALQLFTELKLKKTPTP
jgi:lysophospholipase L1-like esterase